MYLGQIIYNGKSLKTLPFIKVTDSLSTDKIPTLVIGRKKVEKLFPQEKLSVLERRIGANVYWTYSKNERRDDFEEDVKKFEDHIVETYIQNHKYTFFNVLTANLEAIKRFITFVRNKKPKYFFITDCHIFVYNPDTNTTIGISLTDLDYIDISREKVIKKIIENPYNEVIKDDTFLGFSLRSKLRGKESTIPLFYYLLKK